MEDRYENQSGIIRPTILATRQFTLVGVGGIGSFFGMTLSKMGAEKITVFDTDTIEEHNIANQMYPTHSIGQLKTEAIKNVIKLFSGVDITAMNQRFTAATNVSGVVVSAVDNMETRKIIWESVKRNKKMVGLFIDGRMGAEFMRIYCIDPENQKQIEFYERSLHSSSEAVKAACTVKSIIYTVLILSGIMLNLVKRALKGERHPMQIDYDCITSTQVVTYFKP